MTTKYIYELGDLVVVPSLGPQQHFVISRWRKKNGVQQYLVTGVGPALCAKDLHPAKRRLYIIP